MRERFFRRHAQRGIAPETIARITCPIGVPGIEGKSPEVIALATVAQLLQVASNVRPWTPFTSNAEPQCRTVE